MALDGAAMGAAIGTAIVAKMLVLYPPRDTDPPQTQEQKDTSAAKQAEFYNALGEAIGTSVTAYLKANAEITGAGSPSLQVTVAALGQPTTVSGKGKIT